MLLTSKMHFKIMRTLKKISKSFLTLLGLIALFATTLQAQNRKDNIENMHTAYLTEKINLTPEQSQKFWPVYNQFKLDQEELQKQRKQNAQTVKTAGGIDNMSDADVQKLITNEIDVKTRELDL